MSKFRGATNLAEQQRSAVYQRPGDVFHLAITEAATADETGAVVLPFRKFDTGSNIISYPLNERLVLGFRDIEILPDDWDTFGSPAPSKHTLELAKRVAQTFPTLIQPEILPERNGSIGFYWQTSSQEIVIFVDANNESNASYRIENLESGSTFSPFNNVSIWEISDAIRKILSAEFNECR